MQIRMFFKQMETSDALAAYAQQKIADEMAKFCSGEAWAHVSFAIESGVPTVHCEASIGRGPHIYVHAHDVNMYTAVDQVAEKLFLSLERSKEKLKQHRDRETIREENALASEFTMTARAVIRGEQKRRASLN